MVDIKTAEAIIDEDIKKIYLGNLNTVEFDLELPEWGENGTKITWSSDNELFLKPDGSVTRPMNGIGNRRVCLRGKFSYEGIEKEKVYEVCILEEESQIEIIEVLPLTRRAERGTLVTLPRAVILKGDNGHLYSRAVEWEGGNMQIFETCGSVVLRGKVKDEELPAELFLDVKEIVPSETTDTACAITVMDKGETKLKSGSIFYDAMCRAVAYFKSVNEDEMLYNFRKAAGLDTKGARPPEGWDSPECLLRGHTTGHYMSALALCVRETDDSVIRRKLNYMVEELGICQEAFEKLPGYHEGYIGAYSEEQFELLEKGEKYPSIWAPYYTLHKLLAGLTDAYCEAGEEKALEIAVKAAHWVYERLRRLSKAERDLMWDTYIAGEFGGLNETLTKLYEITGQKEFLITAEMFNNDRLLVPMTEKKDTLEGMHANQHVPQIIGYMELFKVTGEKRYYEAAEFFWKLVTERHVYVNGGAGENEMLFEPDAAGEHLTQATAEYCVTYNMLKLTKELFRYDPQSFYMDYYERCMFNHILAGFDKKPTGETTYFFPLSPGAKKDSKFINSCCHGTGMESQMKYTEAVFAHTDKELYVNLFIKAGTRWKEKDTEIVQYVEEGRPGDIKLEIKGDAEFIIKLRRPYWCEGEYTVLVNNRKTIANCGLDGYIIIKREKTVNTVTVQFPCLVRTEKTAGSKDIKAWAYGPYILAGIVESRDFLEISEGLMMPVMEKKEKEGRLEFRADECKDIIWVPLYDIGDRRYHVYWKSK